MAVLQIEHDLPRALAWVGTMRGQMPFAASQALNSTGFDVRRGLGESTTRFFDRPTAFTRSGFMVAKGNKANPQVTIYAGPGRDYLATQIRGGRRDRKGYEKWLGDSYLLPTNKSRNPAGNVRRSLLRDIANHGTQDQSGRARYFAGTPRGGSRPPGVYRRSANNQRLTAVLVAIDNPHYSPRFPMDREGLRIAGRVFPGYFRAALEKALLSAK